MNNLTLDINLVETILIQFLQEEIYKTGFKKVILGISGGIDSAVVAALAVKALGKENVIGLMMPYKTSNKDSLNHAILLQEQLNFQSKTIEITPMIDAYFSNYPDASFLRKGNKMARERMSILFDHSAKESALVLGTSNKTEILMGYSTQFGDSASAINPIGDLYKTHVWDLARHLNIPNVLIDKKPSADLWEGQSDEDDLGVTYKILDEILFRLIDEGMTIKEIESSGFSLKVIKDIIKRIQLTQYKRVLPIIAKLSSRTIGKEFRYPRDWGI